MINKIIFKLPKLINIAKFRFNSFYKKCQTIIPKKNNF